MRSSRVVLALALVCASSLGCRALAASGGIGLGLGAELRLSGLLHTGLLGYVGLEGGRVYGEKPALFSAFYSLLVFHHESTSFKRSKWSHDCLGLLPGVFSEGKADHPWAFEVGVALGFCHFRLGFDPVELFRPAPSEPEPPEELVPQQHE